MKVDDHFDMHLGTNYALDNQENEANTQNRILGVFAGSTVVYYIIAYSIVITLTG